jgi:hypothetical protein
MGVHRPPLDAAWRARAVVFAAAIFVASARSSRRMQAALKTRCSRQLFAIKKPLLRTLGCALSDKFLTEFFIDINHEDQPTTFT